MKKFKFALFLILLLISNLYSDTNFRVMTYNALYFPSANGAGRLSYFQTVFELSEPDILIMQEIENEDGADMLLTTLNANGTQYARTEFVLTDTFYTANMLFYKTSLANLISQDIIETPRRDIAEYVIFIDGNPIRFYSCHLKSSQGSTNEEKRLEEITCLRNHLNSLEEGTEFIIVGDMNFYTSSEPAYQKIIADESNNIGRGQDLSDQVGNWHENYVFRHVHSQSTRVNQFGGGVGGGLDDRFDFIFSSYEINNSIGIEYIDSSLTYFGNDGNHFNQSINYGYNSAVPDSVADALYYASDHLPVFADFVSLNTTCTIYDVQYTTEPGGDNTYPSNYEGQEVTVTGIVTATDWKGYKDNFYISMPEGGGWKGILIYMGGDTTLALGDEIEVTGTVSEYYGMTEISGYDDPITVTLVSTGNPLPESSEITTYMLSTSEAYESVLVKISNVIVTQSPDYYNQWYVDDGSGECQIDDGFYEYPNPQIGDEFASITGVVDYSYNEYGINPRSHDDIEPIGPTEFDVSGNIEYFSDNIPIENVEVNITGDNNYSTTTNENGDYFFNDIPGGDYVSTTSKSDDFGGLSGMDASRIARYVALLYEFDCLEIIAADVSMNGSISSTDASRVARYVALLITELNGDGIDWVFTPEPIPNCDDWPPIVYENTREYTPLESDLIDEDFIGIRLGDVSGNWAPDSRKTLSYESFESTEIETGINSTLRITVVIENVTAIEGIDISIAFDSEVLELKEFNLKDGILSDQNYAIETNLKAGKMVIYALKDLITEKGTVAFIVFDIIGEVGTSSEVYFTKFDLNEKEASGGFKVIDSESNEIITRRFEVNVVQPLPDKFALYQNYPNPFRNYTTISYALPEATNVKIQIYNIRGQLVAELVNGFEAAGRKQIEWDANKYVNGIYFYKMETNNNTFIKKMVLLR